MSRALKFSILSFLLVSTVQGSTLGRDCTLLALWETPELADQLPAWLRQTNESIPERLPALTVVSETPYLSSAVHDALALVMKGPRWSDPEAWAEALLARPPRESPNLNADTADVFRRRLRDFPSVMIQRAGNQVTLVVPLRDGGIQKTHFPSGAMEIERSPGAWSRFVSQLSVNDLRDALSIAALKKIGTGMYPEDFRLLAEWVAVQNGYPVAIARNPRGSLQTLDGVISFLWDWDLTTQAEWLAALPEGQRQLPAIVEGAFAQHAHIFQLVLSSRTIDFESGWTAYGVGEHRDGERVSDRRALSYRLDLGVQAVPGLTTTHELGHGVNYIVSHARQDLSELLADLGFNAAVRALHRVRSTLFRTGSSENQLEIGSEPLELVAIDVGAQQIRYRLLQSRGVVDVAPQQSFRDVRIRIRASGPANGIQRD